MDKFKTRSMIFGVRIDNSQATTLCERIGDAQGLKNNYCIGNSMVVDGENAFDSIYPWCEIKRCNIIEGKIIYDYEAGFTVEQDVFAEIPKFYSCRKVVGNIEEICISGHCHAGFEAEPCFKDAAGNELEHVYVASYQTCVGSRSVSASVPQVLTTQAEFREAAKNKGFSIMDIATWLAIQKLVLIEFADRNMSNHLNGYGCLVYSDAVRAVESAVSSNTIICMGYTAGCFRVGQRVAVSPDGNPFLLADREITAVLKLLTVIPSHLRANPWTLQKEQRAYIAAVSRMDRLMFCLIIPLEYISTGSWRFRIPLPVYLKLQRKKQSKREILYFLVSRKVK